MKAINRIFAVLTLMLLGVVNVSADPEQRDGEGRSQPVVSLEVECQP